MIGWDLFHTVYHLSPCLHPANVQRVIWFSEKRGGGVSNGLGNRFVVFCEYHYNTTRRHYCQEYLGLSNPSRYTDFVLQYVTFKTTNPLFTKLPQKTGFRRTGIICHIFHGHTSSYTIAFESFWYALEWKVCGRYPTNHV